MIWLKSSGNAHQRLDFTYHTLHIERLWGVGALDGVLSPLSLNPLFISSVLSVSGKPHDFPELSISTPGCQGETLHSAAGQRRRSRSEMNLRLLLHQLLCDICSAAPPSCAWAPFCLCSLRLKSYCQIHFYIQFCFLFPVMNSFDSTHATRSIYYHISVFGLANQCIDMSAEYSVWTKLSDKK